MFAKYISYTQQFHGCITITLNKEKADPLLPRAGGPMGADGTFPVGHVSTQVPQHIYYVISNSRTLAD